MHILAIVHAVYFLFGPFLSFVNILKTEQIPRYMKVPCIRRQAETFI
jgi:hypothetical protein